MLCTAPGTFLPLVKEIITFLWALDSVPSRWMPVALAKLSWLKVQVLHNKSRPGETLFQKGKKKNSKLYGNFLKSSETTP